MRIIDVMGMDTARNQWCCATLNEFRTFLKLTRYKSFEGEFPILSHSFFLELTHRRQNGTLTLSSPTLLESFTRISKTSN